MAQWPDTYILGRRIWYSKRHENLLAGRVQSLFGCLPVDDFPDILDVGGLAVLILYRGQRLIVRGLAKSGGGTWR